MPETFATSPEKYTSFSGIPNSFNLSGTISLTIAEDDERLPLMRTLFQVLKSSGDGVIKCRLAFRTHVGQCCTQLINVAGKRQYCMNLRTTRSHIGMLYRLV